VEGPANIDPVLTITLLPGSHGDESMLVLSGELNVQTMYTLRDYIFYCFRHQHRKIRLDMANVTRCEAGALHGVAGIQQGLSSAGGDLRVTSVSAPVREAHNAVTLRRDIFG
jgi:ABC-type transporter Mla MlaB component